MSLFALFLQYIFSCLHGGMPPHLTMVHHSTICKYQEEQGGLSNQVSKSRSQSKPPPLPLKKVKVGFFAPAKKNKQGNCFLHLLPHITIKNTDLLGTE